MNLFSIILLILIGIWFAAAVIYIIKHRESGGCSSSCCGDCKKCRKHCGDMYTHPE